MFEQFSKSYDIKSLTVDELEKLSDEIAVFLASKTRYEVDTIIENINVLETTLALHHVFDLTCDNVIFDGGKQVMVHKILTGRSQELMLRNSGSMYLDDQNTMDRYSGGKPGEGLGVALAYAIENPDVHNVIVLNDYALNYGITYESLVQISRFKPNLTIILIDEQQSLLRHYTSMDALIKSIRISKTYTGLKKDVKSILDSNPISRPILATLTKIRDAVKETVLEPTIFKQFGVDYQGPIDGQNLKELIRVFELSKKYKGPHVIHVQTRLKNKKQRKLEFPTFKTDHDRAENYHTYLEAIDYQLTDIAQDDPDLYVLSDAYKLKDYLPTFALTRPDHFMTTSGSTQALISIAHGLVREGKHVLISIHASQLEGIVMQLRNQFSIKQCPITIIVNDSGLNPEGDTYRQGIFDIGIFANLTHFKVYMGKSIVDTISILERVIQEPQISVIRIPSGLEYVAPNTELKPVKGWHLEHDFSFDSSGVILSFGPSINALKQRIQSNDLDIGLINCTEIMYVDPTLLEEIIRCNLKIVVYDVESTKSILYQNVLQSLYQRGANNECIDLHVSCIHLNKTSKDAKSSQKIHINNVFDYFQ
ncbi:1-deoxy-D-xylulose-5-phosphate synthase N-terminal domain-containing protein [Erysipelothrix sp. strain 2 (EsS2-6-Brazil)]|uniref:1-deoxy-D-xylulose-5-phosphate synthase N-terminal domain-containing protein n=1 Tax=Erysipelothrix sp. strain 2 (EsS2-6-Brazil) TaxID=2500549 RepID=UPI00190A465F|nr:1-deoxy-D-xylulose-5-phosphate synthase N-terminal domain-containing protein [Erysipelothrix sp. strain 2 (EsS2-6-Brazil)]MBK2402502.1 1-deoxy-D-xylulose-5-phosphate synthase [Erysipelothrix sp. strain 2 (EsS2-6-Brazil)]